MSAPTSTVEALARALGSALYVAGQAEAAVRAAEIALDRAREMRDVAVKSAADIRRMLEAAEAEVSP